MMARLASPLSWISRDAGLIIMARGIRTFSQSFIAIMMAIYLAKLGFSLAQIGIFLTVGVAGVSFFAFLVGLFAAKVGRRRFLVWFSLTSAGAAIALFLIDDFRLLLVVAFIGALATGGGGGGESPAQPLEVASLPDTAPPEKRTDLFAIYTIAARTGAFFGALVASFPELVFQDIFHLSTLSSFRAMFLAFAACQMTGALLYSLLSPAIEGAETQQQWTNPLKLPSRRRIFTLTGLFSLDTFTTSMVMQSLMAYWFATKFGLALDSLALVFAFSYLLTASSLWLAAKLGNRIGLINTMVFTHIPSSFFLIGAAFAPTAWVAIVFWQCRAFLSQMDIPTKDSYTMTIVGSEERVAFASINMVSRSAAGAIGPSVTTALWNVANAATPLVGSAVLKITYDLSLYFMFRNVRPPQEEQRLRRRREAQQIPAQEDTS